MEKVYTEMGNFMENVKLELLDKKYAERLLKLWGNENVMKYTYLDTLENVEQVEYRIEFWLKEHTSKAVPNNFVIVKDENVVGVAGFPIIKKEPFCCGMYYQIMEEYQGMGIGTQVVDLMLDMILKYSPGGKVVTSCIASNFASKRILIKNGFEYNGLKKGAFERKGVIDDVEKYVFMKKI